MVIRGTRHDGAGLPFRQIATVPTWDQPPASEAQRRAIKDIDRLAGLDLKAD